MSTNTLFILEMIIFNGVVLIWAAREFWSVRPEKKPTSEAPSTPPSPEDARHPEG